jgi:hypothetical protein
MTATVSPGTTDGEEPVAGETVRGFIERTGLAQSTEQSETARRIAALLQGADT